MNRNPIVRALNKRKTTTEMHDRRQERGGAFNEQSQFLQELEEETLEEVKEND